MTIYKSLSLENFGIDKNDIIKVAIQWDKETTLESPEILDLEYDHKDIKNICVAVKTKDGGIQTITSDKYLYGFHIPNCDSPEVLEYFLPTPLDYLRTIELQPITINQINKVGVIKIIRGKPISVGAPKGLSYLNNSWACIPDGILLVELNNSRVISFDVSADNSPFYRIYNSTSVQKLIRRICKYDAKRKTNWNGNW